MKIIVLMSSGETDTWEDAADAVETPGGLAVLYELTEESVGEGVKTLVTTVELDEPPVVGRLEVPHKATKSTTWQLACVYAPGMWMKVEFE